MTGSVPVSFADVLQILDLHRRTLWLGQSVDTSRVHTSYPDFAALPILTSVGCAIRRPRAISRKFDTGLRQFLGAQGRLMVDSGGYVLMTRNVPDWNVERVAWLYDRIDADHLVSLDVPPAPADGRAVRRRKYAMTVDNLDFLADRFGPRVVPVVHGANPGEVDENCRRILRICPQPEVIGIGGLVPVLQRCGSVRRAQMNAPHRSIAEAVGCVRGHFPHAAVHLFGVGSLHTVLGVLAMGVDSVDSIGWRQSAGFGSVFIPGRHRRLLTCRERERPCRPFVDDSDLALLTMCRCPECRSVGREGANVERLAAHFKPRAAHNIWVLYCEVAEYLLSRERGAGATFLASRLSDAWLDAMESMPRGLASGQVRPHASGKRAFVSRSSPSGKLLPSPANWPVGPADRPIRPPAPATPRAT